MKTTIYLLLAALVLGLPAAALAFDCSSARPLPCDGTPVSNTINLPPELTFAHCGGSTPFKHQLYTLTLAAPAIVTLTLSSSVVGVSELVVFDGCAENQCVAQSPFNTPHITTACLPAGTYTVAVVYLVEALISYDLTATCATCDPIEAEQDQWGGVKALYR